LESLRDDDSGRDAVDAHVIVGPLIGDSPGEVDDTGLRCSTDGTLRSSEGRYHQLHPDYRL
jgi:hypothetical protein